MGLWKLVRVLHVEGRLRVSALLEVAASLAATASILLFLALGFYVQYGGSLRGVAGVIGALSVAALLFSTALLVSESPSARVRLSLMRLRMFPTRADASDLVALSRLGCWSRNHAELSRHKYKACCEPCARPNDVLVRMLESSRLRRTVLRTLDQVMPIGGATERSFSAGMRLLSGGLVESRGVRCCVGHRFPALEAPAVVVTGFEPSEMGGFVPEMLRRLMGSRFSAVGPWWEGSPEAASFARVVCSLAEEPEHVLRTADSLASSWEQGVEELIPTCRVIAGSRPGV